MTKHKSNGCRMSKERKSFAEHQEIYRQEDCHAHIQAGTESASRNNFPEPNSTWWLFCLLTSIFCRHARFVAPDLCQFLTAGFAVHFPRTLSCRYLLLLVGRAEVMHFSAAVFSGLPICFMPTYNGFYFCLKGGESSSYGRQRWEGYFIIYLCS